MADKAKLLTVKEFAAYMGIGKGRAYSLVKSNLGIYSLYIGKHLYVNLDAFSEWLDSQTKKGNDRDDKERDNK